MTTERPTTERLREALDTMPGLSIGVATANGLHPDATLAVAEYLTEALAAASVDRDGLREALDSALIGMVRTSWPMDRSQYEKGWNEAIHAAREKVRAALSAPEPKDRPDDYDAALDALAQVPEDSR